MASIAGVKAISDGSISAHASPDAGSPRLVVTSGSYRQVLGVVGAAGGVSFTPGAGLVERSDVASGTGGGAVSVTVLDRSQAAAGASAVVSTTATASVQSAWVMVALRPLVTVDRQRYVYSATGDTGDAVLDPAGNVIETTVVLPGGVVVSQRGATAVWSYPNVHGDVQATATSSGVKQGATVVYDPFGVVVAGVVPDNVSGGMDYGWLGQHQRPLERGAGLKQVIEMGARPYQPLLGRFLTVDPIEGGTPNAYVYVHDPINDTDLTGMCSRWNLACKALKGAKKVASKTKSVVVGGAHAVRWAYRHTEVSMSACVVVCFGLGFQGGTTYFQGGVGCCYAGVNAGLARREYKDRACMTYVAGVEAGPVGVYGETGSYDRGRPSGDVAGGVSVGAGAGGAVLWNWDLPGQRRYCS